MGKLYKDRITTQGFLVFLDFLPTLNVVKEKYNPGGKDRKPKDRKPREFVCQTCNEKVIIEIGAKDKRTKYCSVACREKNFADRLIKLPTKRLCNFCGVDFEGTAQYCSTECQAQQHTADFKNPVGHVKRTEGVHERICCYDEVHIPEDVMFILECQEDSPRITEDPYYILKCLEDLPVARYSDGRLLTSTRAYRHRKQKGIEVGYNNYKPPILGANRAEKKPKVVDLKQYVTADEKMAKLEREYQNYTVLDDG
ncbi:MAG TPA: hypothetical protein DCS66_02010 [Flavobacteriaceae bacterium]|nr:hypothetical protein [Flavobacteriaceae bacterium]